MFFKYLFFILLVALAFRLRGIWGHQLGGAVFGGLLGFGVSLWISTPIDYSIFMIFSLMLIYAMASFFGWYGKKGFSQFLTGYFVYGMFPNIILSVFLFSNSLISSLGLIFIGSMGMGIGFWISSLILPRVRNIIKKKYESKNTNSLKLVFDKIQSNKEVSHIYNTKFNAWTYLMEIPSGALYGISTIIVIDANLSSINLFNLNLVIFLDFIIFLIFGPLLALLFIIGYKKRKDINPYKSSINQIRWSSLKFVKNSIITSIFFIIFGLIITFLWESLNIKILFAILLWIIIISARFSCENDSKMMKIDILFDFICGLVISSLCFWSF